MKKLKPLVLLCLLTVFPILAGWTYNGFIENSMKELGFKLKKKTTVEIPYSNNTYIHYTFVHPIHKVVAVNEYINGFIEIRAHYQSSKKDPTSWNLSVSRVATSETFRDAIYKIFVRGEM